MSEEDIKVTELIRELEDNRRTSENDRGEALRLKQELQRMQREYEDKLQKISVKRSEVMEKARSAAGEMVRKARLEADSLILEIKNAAARANDRQALSHAQDARSKLKKLRYEQDETEVTAAPGKVPKDVQPGQEVFLPRYNQQGYVLSGADSNGIVIVQVGIMKMNLPLTELRLQKAKQVKETGAPKVMVGKVKDIKTELDLRGLTVDEAMETVEKYLDDAYLAGLPKAYLIHGKGTGALRKAITGLLAGHRFVKNYRLGEYGEGGTGVTVVELS